MSEFGVQGTGRRLVAGTKAGNGGEINLEKTGGQFWVCPAWQFSSCPRTYLKTGSHFSFPLRKMSLRQRGLWVRRRGWLLGNSFVTLRSGYYLTHSAHEAQSQGRLNGGFHLIFFQSVPLLFLCSCLYLYLRLLTFHLAQSFPPPRCGPTSTPRSLYHSLCRIPFSSLFIKLYHLAS